MFGHAFFEPWQGDRYGESEPKLLVLGESRYDEEFTDREIIEERVKGHRERTYTNFVQAISGRRYSEPDYDEPSFWQRVVFYNYNTTFFPGKARVPLSWQGRLDPENPRMLRAVLLKWKPTHVVVWGMCNWESLRVESEEFSAPRPIPGAMTEPYRTIAVDGCASLFARTHHPSWQGFSYTRWAAMLRAFLTMQR